MQLTSSFYLKQESILPCLQWRRSLAAYRKHTHTHTVTNTHEAMSRNQKHIHILTDKYKSFCKLSGFHNYMHLFLCYVLHIDIQDVYMNVSILQSFAYKSNSSSIPNTGLLLQTLDNRTDYNISSNYTKFMVWYGPRFWGLWGLFGTARKQKDVEKKKIVIYFEKCKHSTVMLIGHNSYCKSKGTQILAYCQ